MTISGLILPQAIGAKTRLQAALDQTTAVPFYQTEVWQDALAASPATLSALPRISKADLRENSPRGFLRDGLDLRALEQAGLIEEESTSGTSGASVQVIFGKTWWAEQERRALDGNALIRSVLALSPMARRAVLTTPGCSGVSCFARWLSVEQRTLGATLFVNQARIPFSLAEEKLRQMAAEITAWSPAFLDVDPVHGVWFALYCERQDIRFPSLRFILTSYEYTSNAHRRILERVFGVPVVNLYGSSETGHLLIEQSGDEMIPSEATAILEVADRDERGLGQLLVTTLTNPYLPLVRYEIGDYVESRDGVYQVHGRIRDALRDARGDVITTRMVDRVFAGVEGIAHYQLRQSADGAGTLTLLPETPDDDLAAIRPKLEVQLSALLGFPVSSQPAPLIAPEDSGKFRLTVRET